MLTRNFYLVRYELYAAGTSLAKGTFPVPYKPCEGA